MTKCNACDQMFDKLLIILGYLAWIQNKQCEVPMSPGDWAKVKEIRDYAFERYERVKK